MTPSPRRRSVGSFADCQEDRRVFDSFQGVPNIRHYQEVAGTPVLHHIADEHPDPAAQHLDGGLARVLMLIECGACGQGHDRLAQRVLMPAVVRAAQAGPAFMPALRMAVMLAAAPGELAGRWVLCHCEVRVCGYEDRGLAGIAGPPVGAAPCLGRQH